jgi:carboxyl-terminal processing protease
MSEKEIKTLTVEQLGTNKDGQYRVAETTLLKALQVPKTGSTYQPGAANLQSALQR